MKRNLRRLGWCLGSLVVLGLVGWGILLRCVPTPPPLPADLSITQLAPVSRDGKVFLGKNWYGKRDGLNVLHITGTPFEMGYANGVLTQDLIHRQENTLLELIQTVAPRKWIQAVLKVMVIFQNRHLPNYVAPDIQMEILGLTKGCPDIHPEVGPYFARILSYHGAQDISYMMMNSPLIRGGCTAFAVWGPATVDGHLLTGRNFDWEAAPVFDEDRVLILCEPDRGIPFVSLAWAGMAGCVSGLNREGISITVNGAPSHLPGSARTPTCLVAREVLQKARTLAEATDIIRQSQVFVSALFLVGSRHDGRFIVVEKTCDQTAVREETKLPFIINANHYLTPLLKDDPINLKYRSADTSVSRDCCARELLTNATAKLDAPLAAALLRDRRLPGGVFAGNGHRGSLNPLIATHAVIMDLTAGIFWAATPPHQLGRFVACDVNRMDRELPERTIAADPLLTSGEYDRYVASKKLLEQGRQALRAKDYSRAVECARNAEHLNPGFYQNAWLLGEALLKQGDKSAAREALTAALKGQPAFAAEKRKIEELMR